MLYKSLLDSVLYSGIFLVAGVAAHYLVPFATVPLLATSCSIFISRVVIRFSRHSPCESWQLLMQTTLLQVNDFDKKYPYAPLIILVSSLVLTPFWVPASIPGALFYGLYLGFKLELNRIRDQSRESEMTMTTVPSII